MSFRLARDLGMTRQELGRRITAEEYGLWVQFYLWEQAQQEADADRLKRKR